MVEEPKWFQQLGWYRCRDGSLVCIITTTEFAGTRYPLRSRQGISWAYSGRNRIGRESPADLIEYLGAEKPEQSLTPAESARQDEIDKSICLDPTTTLDALTELPPVSEPPEPGIMRPVEVNEPIEAKLTQSFGGQPLAEEPPPAEPPLREWWLHIYEDVLTATTAPLDLPTHVINTWHIDCVHVREVPSVERIRAALDKFTQEWCLTSEWKNYETDCPKAAVQLITLLESLLGPLPAELKGGE